MKDISKRPVFVVGTPRSGTTLAAKILGRHPNIFTAGELHFISDVYERRSALGNPKDPESRKKILDWLFGIYGRHNEPNDQRELNEILGRTDLGKEFHSLDTYQAMYSLMMDARAARAGKARWGNHVPKDVYYTKEIFEFYPDAKLVVCVRDPRDFLASYKNRHRTSLPEFREHLNRLYHPVLTTLLWKSTVRLILRLRAQIPSDRFLLVRYEDLISRPEANVRRICEYLGEEYSPSMLNISSHNSSNSDGPGEGIFTSSLQRWRSDLNVDEVAIAQWIAGKEMAKVGYMMEAVAPSWLGMLGHALTAPFAAIRALRAARHDRGGLGPYLRRRLKPYLPLERRP